MDMERREFLKKFIINKTIQNEQALQNTDSVNTKAEKSVVLNRREFLEKLAKIAALLGLSSITELYSGCSLAKKDFLSKLLSETPEQMSLEQIKSILQEIPLYVELSQNPRIKIELIESEEIKTKGAIAGWSGSLYLNGVKGKLYFYPYDKLTDPIEKENYPSMIYHELVHIKQDWELFKYFMEENLENKIPEWKMKFYYAKIPELKVNYIGMEIDAYYEQIIFSKERTNTIPFLALYGFFYRIDTIRSTKAYKQYPEIKKYVEELEKTIETISGYTRERVRSEAQKIKNKKKFKNKEGQK